MERREQYKHRTESTDEQRSRRRDEETELRKSRRERLLNTKRVRLEDAQGDNEDDLTCEQLKEATLKLVQKADDKKALLKIIRRGFAQGSALVESFFSVDNSLQMMVGLLTGNDVELQMDAAWCLTNMAAGTHDHSDAVLKNAGAYFVTYLGSSSAPLQDQSSWALGNIAGDCPVCRDSVIDLGAAPVLMKLLQSPESSVVRSAAFALCNLCRGENPNTQLLVDQGIIPLLMAHLTFSPENLEVIGEVCWVLTYLAVGGNHENELVDAGILEKMGTLLIELTSHDSNNYQVLTPVLRCVGNLCSGPDVLSARMCENEAVIGALGRCLQTDHRHIRKESLWAVSNMSGDSSVCHLMVTNGLLPTIVEHLSSTFDIKLEAAYCLCNLASQGAMFTQELMELGALQAVVPMLKSSDPEAISLGLAFAEMALRSTDTGVQMFEKCGGMEGLESLEYHNNAVLREQAQDILDRYFYKDDDEDEVITHIHEAHSTIHEEPMNGDGSDKENMDDGPCIGTPITL